MEQPRAKKAPALLPRILRPGERGKAGVSVVAQFRQVRNVKVAAKAAGNPRQGRIFAKDRRCIRPVERLRPPHALCHLRQNAPIIAGPARCGQDAALAADRAVGIGDAALFLGPGGGGQQHMGQTGGVGVRRHVLHHDKGTGAQGGGHRIGIGHRNRRIGVNDPDRLDAALAHRAEHVDRLQPRPFGHRWAGPKGLDGGAVPGVFDLQMAGQHIGHPADLAPAHRIGLAGYRKRPHAGATDAPGGKVAVQNGVDLVGAGGGLVDALGIDGDDLFGAAPHVAELRQMGRVQPGQPRVRGAGSGQGFAIARDMAQEIGVGSTRLIYRHQQRVEQGSIPARRDCQMQVGQIAGRGAARVDHHDLHLRPGGLGFSDALVQHRVAPREVGAGQHHQIGHLQILIQSRHRIAAKGPPVTGHRGRHAKP